MEAATDPADCIFATGCESCSGEQDGSGAIVYNDADEDGYCNIGSGISPEEIEGCQDVSACNYMEAATDPADCIIATGCESCSGEQDGTGYIVYNDEDEDGYCNTGSGISPEEIIGCQDPIACNYNSLATDSSTCYVPVGCDSCLDTMAIQSEIDSLNYLIQEYTSEVNQLNAQIAELELQNLNSTNSSDNNESSSGDDINTLESELVSLQGQMTNIQNIYNSASPGYQMIIQQQIDYLVIEINTLQAEIDALSALGSSSQIEELNQQILTLQANIQTETENISQLQSELDAGYIVDNDADDDGVCDLDEVVGCQDELACNYNSLATDAADCIFATGCESCSGETDGSGVIVDNDADDDGYCNIGSGISPEEVEGCTVSTACNFMNIATDNDGSCIIPTGCESCSGETDGTGEVVYNDDDYDDYCNLGSGIAPEEVYGCQEDWADNYNSMATEEDSSCYRYGCMYPAMANYDPLATHDPNLSCNFNQDTLDFEVNLVSTNLSSVHAAEIDALNAVHAAEIAALNASHEAEIAALNASHAAEIAALDLEISDLDQQILDLIESHEAEIVALNAANADSIAILNASHAAQIDMKDLEISDLNQQILDLIESHAAEIAALNAAHAAEIAILNAEHAAEIVALNAAHEAQISSINTVHDTEIDALEFEISNLTQEIDSLDIAHASEIDFLNESHNILVTTLESDIDSLNGVIVANADTIFSLYTQIENCVSDPIMVDLLSGWNMIGYTLTEPQDATATFDEISDRLEIVKNNLGDVYLVEWDFNGIGDLIPGQGYQLKVKEAISGFTFPTTDLRINLTPSVPQWALDMDVELHPNDIRTLVRVVNELGQEVDPNSTPYGTVLFYIFNDATVEKRVNSKF